jgi:hypothetical protein
LEGVLRTAAVVRWTKNGSIEDLAATVKEAVSEAGEDARTVTTGAGGDIVIHDDDPISIARPLRYLPGIASIAVGYEFTSMREFERVLDVLATRYLRKNHCTFSVSASAKIPEYSGGDIVMMANSRILSRVQGSKVNEKAPQVRFYVSLITGRGIAGVVIWDGVGGVPTSPRRMAYCLVSGGVHSAATAWLAVRAGFSVGLVHFEEGEISLRRVARLYSELSHRMSPKYLSLQVVSGDGSTAGLLRGWLKKKRKGTHHDDDEDEAHPPVLAGLHLECKKSELFLEQLTAAPRGMVFPVALLAEQDIGDISAKLGLREKTPEASESSILFSGPVRAASRFKISSFGGRRADINTILDSVSSE